MTTLSAASRLIKRQVDLLAGQAGMTERAIGEVVEAVGRIRGPNAARSLRERGIQTLHEVLEPMDVGPLRDQVLERLRQPLLALAVQVGREVLGWEGDFFVDDYMVLRVNFPFEVARKAPHSTENPGTGRLSPPVRDLFDSRKVIHPVFNPRSYQGGHPPAAWAHGPHLDSWTGHSRDGRNLWWALGDVPAEAGMVLYPGLEDENLPCDPRTFYLQPGYAIPAPTRLPLKAGEMLVFDPEVLHGTHLNITQVTRVALSMRLNAAKPTFDPACFCAREFWRRAAHVEQGHDEVLFLRRDDHLGPFLPTPERVASPRLLPHVVGTLDGESGVLQVQGEGPTEQVRRTVVEGPSGRILVLWTEQGLRAYDAACPHNGADLSDGGTDGDLIYCPACAVGFDPCTGRSASPTLALRAFQVDRSDGGIRIRLQP